jgi:hypothetical protein
MYILIKLNSFLTIYPWVFSGVEVVKIYLHVRTRVGKKVQRRTLVNLSIELQSFTLRGNIIIFCQANFNC